ncbi:L-rhamnose/proton symporter RhaT [Asticcacaulis sp. AND118]|uniref:L-rhamnose/proton symporter RhaT n=1 Tax=Asticcacaulis sp. AND118 TaxID=2840468 RepID=UPI001D001588|nr:L-rhamnose/proton symporter RhaT [Asticcacaulis sp. AND118]UDF05330.1 L-rhamnose/proton symporter RhaT [Asticcacaulis sp. AND118]
MTPNPLIGVFFHWLGGLASASFYVPYKKIKLWSWEIFWLTGGIFSWLIAPWIFAYFQTSDLFGVLGSAAPATWFWCVFWGVLWGFGGLTFGLTMRYLGLSLGMAVALGLTTVIGTLGIPIYNGTILALAQKLSGQVTLFGVLVVLGGIVLVARAGHSKSKEVTEVSDSLKEFNLTKGLMVAVFCGVMSACFAFGLDAGASVREASAAAGTGPLWVGLPVLCMVLLGGLTTNLVWSGYLILKNKSASEWVGKPKPGAENTGPIPLLTNYLLAALGGVLWYFQFFFYTMGESQMGEYGFSSWTLHMASIILFSTLWGFALKEWKGTSVKTRALVWGGITTLLMSTIIIGYGIKLAAEGL